MKKLFLIPITCILFSSVYAMGSKVPDGVSLLLIPARPAMVQLGMDMAAQEHALLMTYAPGTPLDQLFLHIWDGSQWLQVPQANYETGTFLKNPVSRLLVVGEENDVTATLIEKAMLWSPEVLHLGTTDVTELINQMGRLYGFTKKDWEWIANRYELELEDLNQDRESSSWYDTNKASDLPPSEKPWKKKSRQEIPDAPETSLRPFIPSEPEVAEPEAEPLEIEVEIDEDPVPMDEPADFSLEVE